MCACLIDHRIATSRRPKGTEREKRKLPEMGLGLEVNELLVVFGLPLCAAEAQSALQRRAERDDVRRLLLVLLLIFDGARKS